MLIAKLQKWGSSVKEGLWPSSNDSPSRWPNFVRRPVQVLWLTIDNFQKDNCLLRASALTFYSLLSVVPVAAMAFGIAKGFGFERRLERELYEKFSGQEAILEQVIEFAHSLLANTRGGTMAGVGLVLLFWAVIKVLSHIEGSFNHIWQARRSRTLVRKFSDYLTIMLISPILILLSSSATVYITSRVHTMAENVALVEMVSPLLTWSLQLIPYALIWLVFFLIYMIMPNTRVPVVAGLLGGIIAGTLFQVVQWGYVAFQIGAARYNAIYGSFAALPLFLIWLQSSWMIVLLGAELGHASHALRANRGQIAFRQISPANRRLVALHVTHFLVHNFAQMRPPSSAATIAETLNYPLAIVEKALGLLAGGGIVTQTVDSNGSGGYQPGMDIHRLSIDKVLHVLNHNGADPAANDKAGTVAKLAVALASFEKAIAESEANVLLINL
jgi:membrane protein